MINSGCLLYIILYIGIDLYLNTPFSFLAIILMYVILHLLHIPVSVRYDWFFNVSFSFISRHTFILNITCLIRLGIHRPSHFHYPTWVWSAFIFLMFPSHVYCFMGRNSMGSEPSTIVRILIFLTSMLNTLNLCNSFGD